MFAPEKDGQLYVMERDRLSLWCIAPQFGRFNDERIVGQIQMEEQILFFSAFAASANGKIFATGFRGGAMLLWDASTFKVVAQLPKHTDEVATIQFSDNGKIIAATSVKGVTHFWDLSR